MPVSAYNKFNDFAEQLLRGEYSFGADVLKAVLTDAAPSVSYTQLSDITEISASGGYPSGGITLTGNNITETGGIARFFLNNIVLTATGADIGPFRYCVIYNSSSASDLLLCWLDYGVSRTLYDGEDLKLNFDQSNGLLTLT